MSQTHVKIELKLIYMYFIKKYYNDYSRIIK